MSRASNVATNAPETPTNPNSRMTYMFSNNPGEGREQAIAFCKANGINPKAPVAGSTFYCAWGPGMGVDPYAEDADFYDEDGNLRQSVAAQVYIITREFVLGGWDGKSRIWHDGCCGSTHFAKKDGRYKCVARPELFGFVAAEAVA